jgi:tetratricopeptide (TPR) repeat protein
VTDRVAGPADPDAYAALEEQRDFLLASLDDLEREREAGDIDQADYEALRDDYTARAASVLRALDEGGARFASARRAGSWKTAAVVVGLVLVFGVGAGLLVARSSGSRSEAPQTDELADRDQLAECLDQLIAQDVLGALQCYDEILQPDRDPDNVEALTYRGWALIISAPTLVADGLEYVDRALEINPDYTPARVFRAFALQRQGHPEEALAELDRADASQIPAAFVPLMDRLRQELEAQVDGSPSPPTTQG